MIKAIETRYKGYRFRSRLEARWAVFFDALGLEWQYEPEGFELPSGRYLPDFLVTWPGRWDGEQSSFWCEVKPAPLDARERELCEQLVATTERECILLVGMPEPKAYTAISIDIDFNGPTPTDSTQDTEVLLWSGKRRPWWTPFDDDVQIYAAKDATYMSAVFAARAARFEYGETPR